MQLLYNKQLTILIFTLVRGGAGGSTTPPALFRLDQDRLAGGPTYENTKIFAKGPPPGVPLHQGLLPLANVKMIQYSILRGKKTIGSKK
mgnify:CR=1 FL=1